MTFVALVALVGAVAGGWTGWHLGTRALYQRSHDPLDPPLANRSSSREFQGRRRSRLLKTVLFAFLGMVAAFVLVFVVLKR